MKQWFTDYFTFSNTERRGVLVLLTLIGLTIVATQLMPFFVTHEPVDATEWRAEVAAFMASQNDSLPQGSAQRNYAYKKKAYPKPEYFPFDPNQLPAKEWKRMGLRDWQVKMIRKYEANGGSFTYKEDVGRIYAINDSIYALLEPHIQLPHRPEEAYVTSGSSLAALQDLDNEYWQKDELVVEVNSADTNLFMELRGIGPVLSKRIVKYRDQLGGFRAINQLSEVYGLRPETMDKISPLWHPTYSVWTNNAP